VVRYLDKDLSNHKMVRRVATETLQSAQGVCTDKMVKSWLVDEQKSYVDSIQFGSENTVKAMEAVGECLVTVYEHAASLSLEKWPVCTHSGLVWVFKEKFYNISTVHDSWNYASSIPGKSKITDRVYNPGWKTQ
jgi:hypothetical protein